MSAMSENPLGRKEARVAAERLAAVLGWQPMRNGRTLECWMTPEGAWVAPDWNPAHIQGDAVQAARELARLPAPDGTALGCTIDFGETDVRVRIGASEATAATLGEALVEAAARLEAAYAAQGIEPGWLGTKAQGEAPARRRTR
jgi:hypothetical protein